MTVPELLIRTAGGGVRTLALAGDRLTVGRATGNDLCYPNDPKLSRNHALLERTGSDWFVRDLETKNGTLVNGAPVAGRQCLRPGDRISAGRLEIDFLATSEWDENTSTLVTTLDRALDDVCAVGRGWSSRHVGALIRAGQELVVHRNPAALMESILELCLEAVAADRGAVMTLTSSGLVTAASRGPALRISTAVRERVTRERVSLLVEDVELEDTLRSQATIVGQNVRTLMAVPLQTHERVLGLVYADSLAAHRRFTSEDLALLTVISNISALGLEHARLAEAEQAEHAKVAELEKTAALQRQALTAAAALGRAESRAILAEAGASVTRLAAALSHELNSPLGALRGGADTLLSAVQRQRAREGESRFLDAAEPLCRNISEAAGRLSLIIGRMQRFTNLDRAEVQLVDLNQLIRDVAALAGAETEGRAGIDLELTPLAPVLCRPQILSAALATLLRRAIESEDRKVAVRTALAGDRLHISIEFLDTRVQEADLEAALDPGFAISGGRVGTQNWGLFSARHLLRELAGDLGITQNEAGRIVLLAVLPHGEMADSAASRG